MPAAPKPLAERWWAAVSPEPTSGCWLWTLALNNKGYGWLGLRESDGAWRPNLAHRVGWVLAGRPLPDGAFLAHKCDNRACVNPDHLFLTDNEGNIADMVAKGRQARGERNAQAKVTPAQIREIRRLVRSRSQRQVARRFGLCQQSVSLIVTRKNWPHVR